MGRRIDQKRERKEEKEEIKREPSKERGETEGAREKGKKPREPWRGVCVCSEARDCWVST